MFFRYMISCLHVTQESTNVQKILAFRHFEKSRNFVVEYKGADRYSNEDWQEKRILGELWAEKSEERNNRSATR